MGSGRAVSVSVFSASFSLAKIFTSVKIWRVRVVVAKRLPGKGAPVDCPGRLGRSDCVNRCIRGRRDRCIDRVEAPIPAHRWIRPGKNVASIQADELKLPYFGMLGKAGVSSFAGAAHFLRAQL